MIKKLLIFALLFMAVIFVTGRIYSLKGKSVNSLPEGYDFGLTDGKLAPCKASPNCICSDHTEGKHYLPPVEISESMWKTLIGYIEGMKGCTVADRKGNYIRLECASSLFGFVDDLELFYDDQKDILRFRSAARLGYSDFGVNRKRMETIISFIRDGEEKR